MDNINKKSRISRKERRKEERKIKKAKKNQYYDSRKHLFKRDNTKQVKDQQSSEVANEPKSLPNNINKKVVKIAKKPVKSIASLEFLKDKMKVQRKRLLIEDNVKEDKIIKHLEKKLKLDKRASKTIPKCFLDSGLDYILDVCDSEKVKEVIDEEGTLFDSDSDFSDDLDFARNEKSYGDIKKENKKKLRKSNFSDNDALSKEKNQAKDATQFEDMSDFQYDSYDIQVDLDTKSNEESGKFVRRIPFNNDRDSNESETDIDDSEQEVEEDSDIVESGQDGEFKSDLDKITKDEDLDECWEDIYGRMRSKDGEIIKKGTDVYLPPHLRNTTDDKKNEELAKLKKELKGFFNKLTSSNLSSISIRIEDLYLKHSRNSVNQTLFDLCIEAVVQPVLAKEQLILDHAMLFTVLHANVGSEVGAFLLTKSIETFDKMYSSQICTENKQLDNLLLLICHMYNFRIFDSCLIFDILKKIILNFKEKDVDLTLVVLKSVGFILRKDDPVSLKDFIISVQKVALTTPVDDKSRMRFMIETLTSIKNNNITKVTGYDSEQNEHMRKIVKTCLRKGNTITTLNIGLEDILRVEERGRWWVIGSSWTGRDDKMTKSKETDLPGSQFSTLILDLAKKQNMNTENKKNIFCILMTSDDPMDACERLLRLGLKGQQEEEISQITLHCLLGEKEYNKYYYHIGEQLCSINRRHQLSFQHALWDKFKILSSLSKKQLLILAKFLSGMILSRCISLLVFKTMPFSELNKVRIKFLRQTFLILFTDGDDDEIKIIFEKICKNKDQGLLRESLRLFLNHFILRRLPEGDLKQKLEKCDNLLTELLL